MSISPVTSKIVFGEFKEGTTEGSDSSTITSALTAIDGASTSLDKESAFVAAFSDESAVSPALVSRILSSEASEVETAFHDVKLDGESIHFKYKESDYTISIDESGHMEVNWVNGESQCDIIRYLTWDNPLPKKLKYRHTQGVIASDFIVRTKMDYRYFGDSNELRSELFERLSTFSQEEFAALEKDFDLRQKEYLKMAHPEERVGQILDVAGKSLELTGVIGKGSYGTVLKARDLRTGKHYALKFLSVEEDREDLIYEQLEIFREENPVFGEPFLRYYGCKTFEYPTLKTRRHAILLDYSSKKPAGRESHRIIQTKNYHWAINILHDAYTEAGFSFHTRENEAENILVAGDGTFKLIDFGPLARG